MCVHTGMFVSKQKNLINNHASNLRELIMRTTKFGQKQNKQTKNSCKSGGDIIISQSATELQSLPREKSLQIMVKPWKTRYYTQLLCQLKQEECEFVIGNW